jgi:Tetratricopeptide repeat
VSLVRALPAAVLCFALIGLPSQIVRATSADSEQARGYFDRASAAFALGHYPVAAENFEKAFELKPDPALLYNAAQAHRLAGNKERALTLYQNYLRMYARAGKRAEVESRIEELKKAIERDREVATSPPITTIPTPSMPASPGYESGTPASSATAPSSTTSAESPPLPAAVDTNPAPASPVLVGQPEPAVTEKRRLTQKPLFWAAVGGVVAAAVAVVVIVALSGAKDPSPSFGVVK